MKIYYFLEGSVKYGPLTRDQLISQHLPDSTLVYDPDTDSWRPYAEIKDALIGEQEIDANIENAEPENTEPENTEQQTPGEPEESPKHKKTMKIIRYSLYALGFILLITPKILAMYYEHKAESLARELMEKDKISYEKQEPLPTYKHYSKNGLSFTYPSNYVIYKDTVVNDQWLVRCKNPKKQMEKIQFTIEAIEPEAKEALKNYSRKEICQEIFDMSSSQLSVEFKQYDLSNRTIDQTDDYYSITVDYVGTLEYAGHTGTMQGKLKVLVMDDFVVRCNTYTETEKKETEKVFDSMTFTPHRP